MLRTYASIVSITIREEHGMADSDQILRVVLARLDALEQRNQTLAHENHQLQAQIATAEGISGTSSAAAAPALNEPLSRRHMLRHAIRATAASVIGGVLVQGTSRETKAGHITTDVNANAVIAHSVTSTSEAGKVAISGSTSSSSSSDAAVEGTNFTDGSGVYGHSPSASGVGVFGFGLTGVRGSSLYSNGVHGNSNHIDASGVYGSNTYNGFGVAGDTTSARTADIALARAGVYGRNHGTGAGVFGRSINSDGDGVIGVGKVGVHGTSANGNGILGEGGTGYGGVFKGARAQVRLAPTTRIGKPTSGTHQIGELYLDKVGSLFICTVAGAPGTWKTVTVS